MPRGNRLSGLLLFFLYSSLLGHVSSTSVETSRSRLRILYHIETVGYAGTLAGVGLVRIATRNANATFDRIPIHTRTPQEGTLFLDSVYCPDGRDGNNTCTPFEIPQLCGDDTDPSRKVHLSHLKRENYTRQATLHELARNPERPYYVEWLGGGIQHIDVVVYLILDCSPMEWQVPARPCRYSPETGMPILGRVCVDPRQVDQTGTQLVHDTLHILAFWPSTLQRAGIADPALFAMTDLPVLGGMNSSIIRVAREMLQCFDADSPMMIPIINGQHWSPKYAGDDIMLECVVPNQRKIGPLTMALLNDTPWWVSLHINLPGHVN